MLGNGAKLIAGIVGGGQKLTHSNVGGQKLTHSNVGGQKLMH